MPLVKLLDGDRPTAGTAGASVTGKWDRRRRRQRCALIKAEQPRLSLPRSRFQRLSAIDRQFRAVLLHTRCATARSKSPLHLGNPGSVLREPSSVEGTIETRKARLRLPGAREHGRRSWLGFRSRPCGEGGHEYLWIIPRDYRLGFYQLISGYCVNVYDRKVELFSTLR